MPNITDYKSSLRISVSSEVSVTLSVGSSLAQLIFTCMKRRKVGKKATTKTKTTHNETLTLTHISILVIKWVFGCISNQNTCHFQTKNNTHFTRLIYWLSLLETEKQKNRSSTKKQVKITWEVGRYVFFHILVVNYQSEVTAKFHAVCYWSW